MLRMKVKLGECIFFGPDMAQPWGMICLFRVQGKTLDIGIVADKSRLPVHRSKLVEKAVGGPLALKRLIGKLTRFEDRPAVRRRDGRPRSPGLQVQRS